MDHSICLYNGRIYGPQGLQDATAIIIGRGLIRYVGDDARRTVSSSATRKDRCRRASHFSGFTDSHLHLSEWAKRKEHLDLNPFPSLKDTCAFIREQAGNKKWLTGGGWNQNVWVEKRFPHRRDLDFATDVKAVFYSKDFHSAWVNAAVIECFDMKDVFAMLKKGV
ncbi:MAG: amidohydrolase family protein [Candidatus Marinimicrobia bacterium]|nr:amidohydrolase family protein [Candidatus Neomarinimicrobiota bacterium]